MCHHFFISSRRRRPQVLLEIITWGSLALMEAAERYDTSGETPFDAYSGRIIKSAMLDYIYRNATQFTMPPDRFRVLRRVARLLADGGGVQEICGDLNISPAVARKLTLEYRETFNTVPLDDADADTGDYGNPEQVYTEKLQRTATLEALNSLSSRSRTIIKYHLGLDQPDEQTMTFQDLAVHLNLAEHFTAHVAILQRVYSILSNHFGSFFSGVE